MEVKSFKIVGYSDIYNQVIIGGSKIKVILELIDYNNNPIDLDISNYSKKGKISLSNYIQKDNIFYFSEIIKVDFLGDLGMNCCKNDEISRVNIKLQDKIYYSNTVGNYKYIHDYIFANKENDDFDKKDHHLGVYNKNKNDYNEATLKISEYNIHKNDIIFMNRGSSYLHLFINLDSDINLIISKYLHNLKRKENSIFFIDIFNTKITIDILKKIDKIISVCKEGTYYIYNIDYKYLDKYNYDKEYFLYSYHFKPVFGKK